MSPQPPFFMGGGLRTSCCRLAMLMVFGKSWPLSSRTLVRKSWEAASMLEQGPERPHTPSPSALAGSVNTRGRRAASTLSGCARQAAEICCKLQSQL
ncbi:hypothetical protein GDO78_014112 [Eleutherodactylus coqui]|uniref:Uncharacterized protein n=1 Tax=Eleutherodactylus coqui TaxID=57060 RepID=A0A8J6EEW6_ELECQ|nr:hypothetical protein GDO78_014112 [Eleutherodactylus coqui]